MRDKYKATWISHSSIGDFLSCERLYFLKNVFKDSKTRRKINIASPYLSLGIAVHNTLEALKKIKTIDRKKEIKENLLNNFNKEWQSFKGINGGFDTEEREREFYERGVNMIEKVIANPSILLNKIIPDSYFYAGDMLPHYFINDTDNIILCGSIDWIEYLEENKSMRIVDFKTGRNDESDESYQLPIYYLLIKNLDEKKLYKVSEFAYWYLDQDSKKDGNVHDQFHIIKVDEEKLKDIEKKEKEILEIGRKMHKARTENLLPEDWICKNERVAGEGCIKCRDFERVYRYLKLNHPQPPFNERENEQLSTIDIIDKKEEVVYVGVSGYNQDVYFINRA